MTGAASVTDVGRGSKAAIVAAYALVFFVALPGLLAALGLRLDALLHLPKFGGSWRVAGSGLAAVGVAAIAGTMLFLGRAGRGWPVSHLPPVAFVSAGPYVWMRHPIYVAYTLALVGAGLAAGSPGIAFASSALLLCGWLIYVLGFEEPKLCSRFGAAYERYRARVPLMPLPGRRVVRRAARRGWAAVRPVADWLANRLVLARIGPTVWVSYGAFVAAGTMLGLWLLAAPLLASGLSPAATGRYVVFLAAAMLVGSRVAWLAYHARELIAGPVRVLRTVGFVSWGAIAVGIVVPLVYARAMGVSPLWLMDCTLLGLAGCGTLGRLGCFTYGCCFGRESRHGVRWTEPAAKVNRIRSTAGRRDPARRRVPTQLIEAALLAAIVLAAFGMIRHEVAPGAVAGTVLLLYGVGRFAADCLRDERRFGGWRLTAGQIGASIAAATGLALLLAARGASPWPAAVSWLDAGVALRAGPAILFGGGLVFLVTAFHWRDVGRW